MIESMPPLDPRLLDALRAESPAPAKVRERVRARLEAVVPDMRRPKGGGQGGTGGAGPLGSHSSAIVTFVAGGVTGAALLAALAGARPAQIVYVERGSSEKPPAGLSMPALSMPMSRGIPEASSGLPPADSAAATVTIPSKLSPVPSRAARLAAERILLDQARAALLQGEPDRALERIKRHRERFPDGLLAEERDAMQIEALVQAHRYDEARVLAIVFRTRLPGSLFLPTVDATTATMP